jgi:hypothetical protein
VAQDAPAQAVGKDSVGVRRESAVDRHASVTTLSAFKSRRRPGSQEHRAGSAMCMGCQHVRKHVSERDLNPHAYDPAALLTCPYRETDNRRSEICMCVRGASAPNNQCILTAQFSLVADGA